jgi:hypothetical protein
MSVSASAARPSAMWPRVVDNMRQPGISRASSSVAPRRPLRVLPATTRAGTDRRARHVARIWAGGHCAQRPGHGVRRRALTMMSRRAAHRPLRFHLGREDRAHQRECNFADAMIMALSALVSR